MGDALIKAGLAHLWLVTLHPFDDGNGRISRAVGDMALARAEGFSAAGPPQSADGPRGGSDPRSGGAWGQHPGQRFYSFSARIQRERKDYYDQLESTQKGPLDVTPWLCWFLGCLLRAVQGADATLAGVLDKAQFWQRWAATPMNARQTQVLNRVLDGLKASSATPGGPRWTSALPTQRCATLTTCWRVACCASWRVAGAARGMSYVPNRV